MSLGPHRTPYGFSAMSSTPNSLPRQHVMNAPTFQQVVTIVPASNPPTLPTHHNNNNNNNNNNSNNNNNNNNNGAATSNASITRHATAGVTPQNLYCDNCQTFRHVAFFQEKEYKYKVCKMCSERELQKRLYNKERYEQYEEQQKNLKHNRYSIQQHQQRQQQAYSVQTATSVYAQQAQVPSHYANSNNTAANPTPAPSTSSQIPMQLPQMPIGLGGGNASANLPPPPNLATPTNSNNASPQISTPSSSMMLGINMKGNNSSNKQHTFQTVAILPNSNNANTTTNNNNNNNVHHDQQQLHMHQVIQPSLPLPNPSIAAQRNRASNRAASNASITTNVNLISLDEFVEELKRHIDFDRKLYHIDIQSLIQSMGPSAGFTQLGRKICEKVLEGTKFNFSLKDRRRSTKSPDTLSTLRYYCSQRIDTAKPRKAEHPKAQLKYDCAGALTIIIDLLKKSAHVTVIHRHAHPPFVSHHHQIKHQQQQKRQIQPLQQQLQQQQKQQKHQQEDDQQQRLLKLTKQKQHQISKQFEQLKQTVNEIGLLLDSQTPYANEDFLKVASEALSEASEMVRACKAAEENSDVIYPPNKYTLHYKKRGDYGNLF